MLDTEIFGGTVPLVLGRLILCVDTVTFETELSVLMLVEVLPADDDPVTPADEDVDWEVAAVVAAVFAEAAEVGVAVVLVAFPSSQPAMTTAARRKINAAAMIVACSFFTESLPGA